MENIEYIISIVLIFVSFLSWMIVTTIKATTKWNNIENRLGDCEDLNSRTEAKLNEHDKDIHELKTELATIRSSFTNIDLKIEHLTNKHEETQTLIQQVQKDNHELHTTLIKTINNVILK